MAIAKRSLAFLPIFAVQLCGFGYIAGTTGGAIGNLVYMVLAIQVPAGILLFRRDSLFPFIMKSRKTFRSNARFDVSREVTVECGNEPATEAYLENVSANGFRLQFTNAPQIKTGQTYTLKLAHNNVEFRIEADAVRAKGNEFAFNTNDGDEMMKVMKHFVALDTGFSSDKFWAMQQVRISAVAVWAVVFGWCILNPACGSEEGADIRSHTSGETASFGGYGGGAANVCVVVNFDDFPSGLHECAVAHISEQIISPSCSSIWAEERTKFLDLYIYGAEFSGGCHDWANDLGNRATLTSEEQEHHGMYIAYTNDDRNGGHTANGKALSYLMRARAKSKLGGLIPTTGEDSADWLIDEYDANSDTFLNRSEIIKLLEDSGMPGYGWGKEDIADQKLVYMIGSELMNGFLVFATIN